MRKFLGVVGRMRRQRNVDEGDQREAERFAGEIGVIAGDDFLLLQPHPPPRALRCRQTDDFGELLIGQPAVILQRGQDFKVEGIYGYHALNAIICTDRAHIAESSSVCTHFARRMAQYRPQQIREISHGSISARRAGRHHHRRQSDGHRRL